MCFQSETTGYPNYERHFVILLKWMIEIEENNILVNNPGTTKQKEHVFGLLLDSLFQETDNEKTKNQLVCLIVII